MEEIKRSGLTLQQAKMFADAAIADVKNGFVSTGYYLKTIRDEKLWKEQGYTSFEAFLNENYEKDKSWASRCISLYEKFGVEISPGELPKLNPEFIDYNVSQLIEMISLPDEKRELVTPETSVRAIREMKPKREKKVETVATSEQEEKQDQEPEETQDRTAYVKEQYRLQKSFLYPFAIWLIKNHKAWFTEDYMNRVIKVDKSEGQLKSYLGAYPDGSSSYGFPVDSETYYAKLYDNKIVISHFADGGTVVVDGTAEWFYLAASIQVQWNVVALEEVQAEDQEIDHFLNRNESIDDAYGWFRSAMVKEYLKSGYNDQNEECEITVLGSIHRVLKSKEVTLFYDDSGFASFDVENTRLEREYNYFFGHRDVDETVIEEPENVPEQEESVPESSESVIDGVYEEVAPEPTSPFVYSLEDIREETNFLKEQLKLLGDEDSSLKFARKLRMQYDAILLVKKEFENYLSRQDDESEEAEGAEQPELPILKNNDQRAAFIDAYETWPLWIETKETGERYYRYDLLNGTSMVVKVYHAQLFDYKATGKKYEDRYYEGYGKHEYYYLKDGKFFRDCETNRSYLIERLKELQKKVKGDSDGRTE